MKYLFDIDGIAYEIELEKGETKQLEYKKGRFAKVSLHQISMQPTTTDIGSAFLRVEFDNGNIWRSKDAVIPRIITEQERQRWRMGKDIAELRKQAQRGAATIDIPIVGPVTFTATDVDSLYRHIMQ